MYESKQDLPETLRADLPEEAQDIYIEAYNEAWQDYDEESEPGETSRESVATRIAWATVKRDYVFHQDTGRWYRRGEEPADEDEDEEGGILDDLGDVF